MLNYSRRTWAEIDLDALEHNYKTACALAKGAAVMPVIKADAYGHGAPYIARCLERLGAAYFAVSNLDEAKQLRNEGCRAHILILGYTPPAGFPQLFSLRLTQTVMTLDYASALSAAALTCGTQACVHIKADTGMGRLGLDARRSSSLDGAVDAIRQICAMPGLQCEGLYTHFAVSDIPEEPYTAAQLSLFQSLLDRLAQAGISIPLRHASNSGGILNYPGARLDMVRQGISLYGMYPDSRCRDIGLKPVMRLVTIVTQVHPLRMGESVSYGRTYTADADRLVAVLAAGYADGYPRLLSNRAFVTICGRRCPVLGRVCMDQMIVDVTDVSGVKAGDQAVLFGGGPGEPTAGDLADLIGTIHYELLCNVSARVPRVYMRAGEAEAAHSYIL